MDLAFFINEYMVIILIIILILFGLFIFFNFYELEKIEKEREEFVKNLIACAVYDSKYRINKYEVARKK